MNDSFLQLLTANHGPEFSITLHTRKGREVRNVVESCPITPRQRNSHFELVRKFGFEERTGPCGGYNCFGMTWASRRTCLFDDIENEVQKIFNDDGYRIIKAENEVKIGDLAVYWDSLERRSLHHAGIVFEFREVGNVRIPWILSKLDSTCGEVLHHAKTPHFNECHLEYWTERDR